MTIGRPVADLDDFLDEPPPRLQPAPESAPTHAVKPQRARWIIAVAALLVVAGGVGYWFTTRTESTPTPGEPYDASAVAATVPDGVAGFAELFVIAYLRGNAQDVAGFLPGVPTLEAMTPGAHVVRHAAVVESDVAGDDYWTVTVAADVLDLGPAGYVDGGLAYFQVGVVDDGGRLVATALPSRVAAPAARTAAPRFMETPGAEPAPEIAALVGDFLEALLTDGREVNRYVAVDSSIAAIRPAPYTAIAVTALGEFSRGLVLATIDAQAPNGAINTLQYVVRIEDQGGALVVAELIAGPPRIDGGDQ